MKNVDLLFLAVTLIGVLVFPVDATESEIRLSLKQLIAESKKQHVNPFGFTGLFSEVEVRKSFFGDEAAFLREVVALLQTDDEKDVFDAYRLIEFLDIRDDTISKIQKAQFSSAGLYLQHTILRCLGKDMNRKEDVVFLLEVLEQSSYPTTLRISAAALLSKIENFEALDTELKNRILNAHLSYLDDERQVYKRSDDLVTIGDRIAHILGNFGSSAKPALPTIKMKFNSTLEEIEFYPVKNKLRLALAIVKIAPEQCDTELEYIIHKSMEDQPKYIRREAIDVLGMVPPRFSERVVPRLCMVIQNETNITNKILAVESIEEILQAQQLLIDIEADNDEPL